MAGFRRSVTIARPIEEVFEYATDLANLPQLLPGVTKTELLTPDGIRAGAKIRETRGIRGKEQTAVIEICEHRPPNLHAARSTMMGLCVTYRFHFHSAGEETVVDMDAKVEGNPLWKLFLGMISRAIEKEDGEYLNRLKRAVEESGAKAGV
jgi:carbon monoxide dehydrogenase subunit G